MLELLLSLLFAMIDSSSSYGSFPSKYIGNYLTLEEYNNLTLCDSSICMNDAQRLIVEASYDTSIDPCKNFEKFACGTFYQERARNERYETVGFKKTFELRNDEKRHRALKVPVTKNDGKAVRIVKNLYQKCINWSKF
jgi:hypothetical protein